MAYATVSDVETYCPARAPFTGSTLPSASVVAALLVDINAEAEAVLVKAGYIVPIPAAATAALAIMRGAVAKGGAAMVERVAPTSRDRDASMRLWTEAKKMLEVGQLPDYPKGQPDVKPRQGPDAAGASAAVAVDMVL